jgi:hypothetical protein
MEKITLPICIPYLKEKSTGQQNYAQLSLSLFEHLSKSHFPDQKDGLQLCYSLLRTASAEKLPALEQIQTVPGISCRKIQNLLCCRSICPACPYSASYQNRFEKEESFLLSYILQDYSNFACMFSFHLKPSFFKALFYCKGGDSFLGYPLHSSLYKYMLENYHLGSQRNQLLQDYFTSLKEELGKEIAGNPQELIKAYINNLIKNGKGISLELVSETIQTITDTRKQSHSKKKETAASDKAANTSQMPVISLNYMLSADNKIPKAKKEEPQITSSDSKKQVSDSQNTLTKSKEIPSASPKHISPIQNVEFKELGGFLLKQAEIIPPAQKPEDSETSVPAASILTDFYFSFNDLAGYPYYNITPSSMSGEFELLENKLLISSYISLEGGRCIDDDQDYILLYMDECYFVFTFDCHRAMQLLSSVMKRKSSLRKFLSFDGYYISWLLSNHGILPEQLISIQQTFRFQHRASAANHERTPEELITLLENRYNRYGLAFYCYAMKYYPHMYQQLNLIPIENQSGYKADQYFHQLLGISYYLPSMKERSFNIDGLGNLIYLFPELKPASGFIVVHFKVETENAQGKNIMEVILIPALTTLYRSQLCLQCKLNLIFLAENEIRISFLSEYLVNVTESLHLLLSYYGEHENVYIKVSEQIFT